MVKYLILDKEQTSVLVLPTRFIYCYLRLHISETYKRQGSMLAGNDQKEMSKKDKHR